jgi:hypothetical protein
MVTCSCGTKIEKIPDWLSGIKVEFVCNNCPNRQHKNIAVVSAEIDRLAAAGVKDLEDDEEMPDDEDEE